MDPCARAEKLKCQGNSSFLNGDCTSALSYYSQAIVSTPQALNPSQSVYFSNRARVFFHQKRWKDTIKDCESAIQITIQNVKAAILLARAKASLGRDTGALELLQEAEDQADYAKRQAKREGNAEFVSYCKELRWKIQSFGVYQQRLVEDREKARLAHYYAGVLRDARLLAVLGEFLQPTMHSDEPEESILCPITLDVFRDPVCTSIGHTYEREALQQAFRLHGYIDPITRYYVSRENLTVGRVHSSRSLSKAARAYQRKHPWTKLGKKLGEVVALGF